MEEESEEAGGLRERAERTATQAQLLLDLLELTEALDRTQRVADRVEQIQQQQRHVVVHVQLPVAGPVPFAADVMQLLQQPGEGTEILESLQIRLSKIVLGTAHAASEACGEARRKLK